MKKPRYFKGNGQRDGVFLKIKVESYRRVYLKVSGLAAWSENCKWYSSLPLGEVVSLL
jgi:hypothetical protein